MNLLKMELFTYARNPIYDNLNHVLSSSIVIRGAKVHKSLSGV